MILVLTGPVHSGKTSLLRRLLPDLQALSVPLRGYLCPAAGGAGDVPGYDFLELGTGRLLPFLRPEGEAGWQRVGPYFLLPGGLEAAESSIRSWKPGELLVVDEVGPLEFSGRGVWPALFETLNRPSFTGLIVVRKHLLDDLRARLPVEPFETFDIETRDVPAALAKVLSEKMRPK